MTTISMTVDLVDLLADDAINARRTRNDEGIDELKASIRAHGLIQALRVRRTEISGKYAIVAGSRRHRVLCELATDGDSAGGVPVSDSFQVPVLIGEDDDATARELSQAENFIRLPQHEADTYETFRELADRGLSENQIAARFGVDVKRVRRMLALGRLSPLILEAWREGWFKNETVETVRAFTLAPSIEEQERVFLKAKKEGGMWPHMIRAAFGAGDREASKHLTFVGIEAYGSAGGHVTEDLFDDHHVVSDPGLAKRLADEKLAAKCEELRAEGWSWVSLDSDLPPQWSWSWQKLATSKKKTTKEQKATSGVVVKLKYDGTLDITYGVVKPAETKTEAAKSDGPKEKAAPTISNAMHQRLSGQATLATRAALRQEPRLGLVALLAGFIAHRHLHTDSPVRVYHDGFGKTHGVEKESFASAFDRLFAMSDEQLFMVAAGCAGEAVHMERGYVGRMPFDANASPLAAAIDPDRMTAALHESFDAVDYFNGIAKPLVIQAIREAVNDDEARKADKLKKKELVEFAVKNVQGTGWLPPELRCATYSGPGEIPHSSPLPIEDDADFDEIDEEDQDEAA